MTKSNDLMELVDGCGVAKSADVAKVPMAKETAELLAELGFKVAAENINRRVAPILKMAEIAAGGYVEITPEKIQEFVNRKAKEYDQKKTKAKSTVAALRDYLTDRQNYTYTSGSTTGAGAYGIASTTANLTYLQQAYYDQMAYQGARYNYVTFDDSTTLGGQLAGRTDTAPALGAERFTARTADYSNGGEIGQYVWTEMPVETYPGIPPMDVLRKFRDEKAKKIFDFFSVASVNAIKDPLLLGRINGSANRWYLAQWGSDVSLDDVI